MRYNDRQPQTDRSNDMSETPYHGPRLPNPYRIGENGMHLKVVEVLTTCLEQNRKLVEVVEILSQNQEAMNKVIDSLQEDIQSTIRAVRLKTTLEAYLGDFNFSGDSRSQFCSSFTNKNTLISKISLRHYLDNEEYKGVFVGRKTRRILSGIHELSWSLLTSRIL